VPTFFKNLAPIFLHLNNKTLMKLFPTTIIIVIKIITRRKR
jgi:hypothetical protein